MFMAIRMLKAARARVDSEGQRKTAESLCVSADTNVPDLAAEIDQIFGEVKAIKKRKAAQGQKEKAVTVTQIKKRRYTEDGLPIYTEEELGINNPKAGSTPLCPFECDCCH
jgi:hypothetical protein